MDLFGILVQSFLVKAVDFDLRAFCFRWVQVFGTIFGEERYCEAFLGDYDQGKKREGEEERRLALPYTWGIWNWDEPRTEERRYPDRSYLAFGAGLGQKRGVASLFTITAYSLF